MRRFWPLLCLCPSLLLAQGRAPEKIKLEPFAIEPSSRCVYRIVEDDAGGFYVLWTQSLENVWRVQALHYSSEGTATWDGGGLTLAAPLNDPDNWDAVSDGKKGLLITWVNGTHVRGQRWSTEGQSTWPEGLTVSDSIYAAATPVAVADALGGAYFVWSEKRFGERWVLFAQRLNVDGTTAWAKDGARVSLRASDQRGPRISYDGQSGYIVLWQDKRAEASQVQVQRIDFQGNRLWGDEGILVTAPGGGVRNPALLQPLGAGSAVVGWRGSDRGVTRLFLQSLDSKGKFRWKSEGIHVSFGNVDQWNPALYGDGTGTLWTGWADFRDNQHWQVFVSRMDADAHQFWTGGEVGVGATNGDQGHVAVTENGRGGVLAAWLDNRASRVAVYAQEIDPEGRRLLGEQGTLLASDMKDPAPPRIAAIAPGRGAVLWADRRKKGPWKLYWAFVEGPQ